MISFYDDNELVNLCRTFDRLMFDKALRGYVEAFRHALFTGVREFELAAIQIEHCHANYIEIPHGKGAKSRVVDIHPAGVPYYQLYLRERQQAGGKWLFPGSRSSKGPHVGPVATRTLRKWWKWMAREAGIHEAGLHELRRTFTTWAQEWMSITDLMRQLGHSKYDTTLKSYAGSIPGRKFCKDKPEWIKVAEAGGQRLLEEQGVIEITEWRKRG